MGTVVVEKKPDQKILPACSIEPLKSYRAVRVDAHDDTERKWCNEGDILVSIQCQLGGREVLNTRTSKLLLRSNGFVERVFCVRDFSVQSVSIAFDDNEMPA
jgi:hypothetical protein